MKVRSESGEEARYAIVPQIRAYDKLPMVLQPYMASTSRPKFRSSVANTDRYGSGNSPQEFAAALAAGIAVAFARIRHRLTRTGRVPTKKHAERRDENDDSGTDRPKRNIYPLWRVAR